MIKPYYEQSGITIYHGDCREILPLLDHDPGVLILADPPYGITSVSNNGKMGGAKPSKKWARPANKVYIPVHDDDKPMDATWLMGIGSRQIIWGADHFVGGIPHGGRLLVWDKRNGVPSNDFADAEVAWDSAGGPCRLFHHRQMGMVNDGYGDIGRCHPNQKPLALVKWVLGLTTERLVVDPYFGSGTTLRAAKDMGRRAIGIEIDERYCEIAARRLAQEVLVTC